MSAVAIIPLLVQLSEPGLEKVENSLKRSSTDSAEPVMLALDIMASNEMPKQFYQTVLATTLCVCGHICNWFLFKEFFGFEPVMMGLVHVFHTSSKLFSITYVNMDYTKVLWPFHMNCLYLNTGPSGAYNVKGHLCQLPTHAVLQDFFGFLWIEGLITASLAALHVLVILTLLVPCHRRSILLHKAPHQAKSALSEIVWKFGPNDFFVVLKLIELLSAKKFKMFCYMYKRRGPRIMTRA